MTNHLKEPCEECPYYTEAYLVRADEALSRQKVQAHVANLTVVIGMIVIIVILLLGGLLGYLKIQQAARENEQSLHLIQKQTSLDNLNTHQLEHLILCAYNRIDIDNKVPGVKADPTCASLIG